MPFGQTASSYALSLPELVVEIGQYLTNIEVIGALQVCKGWHALLQPLLVQDVFISYTEDVLPPLDLLARYSRKIRTITIIGRPGRHRIEYFDLRGCTVLNPVPRLSSLSLRHIELSEGSAHYFWAGCRELEDLEIGNCDDLRHVRSVYTDLKAAAVTLQEKLDAGVHN
ncbi:hypothetical protein BGZ79_002355 [Entomortierella chlamydospora]|nr:hypothetical protein BGZ79_002355 [Entomortierella chlamydospora]